MEFRKDRKIFVKINPDGSLGKMVVSSQPIVDSTYTELTNDARVHDILNLKKGNQIKFDLFAKKLSPKAGVRLETDKTTFLADGIDAATVKVVFTSGREAGKIKVRINRQEVEVDENEEIQIKSNVRNTFIVSVVSRLIVSENILVLIAETP